jgi:hypothetical protein
VTIIDWLNANAGAVTGAATVIYAGITLLLLFEARRVRQLQDEAALTVGPTLWGDGLYLALALENYGPAVARDVRLRFWFEIDGKLLNGSDLTYADPVFGPGRRRRFLPDSAGGKHLLLKELGNGRHVLHAELSWADDRLDLRRRRARHEGRWSWAAADMSEGFYNAHPLRDKELVEVLDRHAGKIHTELKGIKREAEVPRQRREARAWQRQREAELAERAEGGTAEEEL